METNNKKLITHNGSFHSDDIFAAAALSLMLEKKGETFQIIRTRDEELIQKGDYVFDVGGVYDADANRFDHHQISFKEKRSDDIMYSSFGLVWKKFGNYIAGGEKIASILDLKLVAPIDAGDNGFDLVENKNEVSPYFIQNAFSSMKPTWCEENLTNDEMFLKSVAFARDILSREIIQIHDALLAEESVLSFYKNSADKRIIILDRNYPSEYTLNNFPEPLFVIYPRTIDNTWGVRTVRKDVKTFNSRKDFPNAWGGLREEELKKVTGVEDAVFCHRGLYLAVARSKEGAIKLAELALSV